jgi:hypothetical protein
MHELTLAQSITDLVAGPLFPADVSRACRRNPGLSIAREGPARCRSDILPMERGRSMMDWQPDARSECSNNRSEQHSYPRRYDHRKGAP